jgi:ribosomal protein S2
MIKKKKNNNILLNLLFKSKNIYGESLNDTTKDMMPFIYGIRHNYTIINLKNISFYLKRIFKLLEYMLKKQQKILVIGNSEDIKFLVNKKFVKDNKNILFFHDEWVNGFITNNIANTTTTTNKKISLLLKEKEIELILIIKSSVNEHFLNQELSSLDIPIISFVNTSQSLKHINYPIVSNSKNIKSLYSLMYLLRKIF